MSQRIALLGGSFNPPHVGHQMIMLWILATGRANQTWLIPCFQHPFNKTLVSFEHRMKMCQLIGRPFNHGFVRVSSVEKDIGGVSHSIETLQKIRANYPQHHFLWVIGSDILMEKDSWHQFESIESMVELLVIGREGYKNQDLQIVLPNISSSMIRSKFRRGEKVTNWLPHDVLAYIYKHHLYL